MMNSEELNQIYSIYTQIKENRDSDYSVEDFLSELSKKEKRIFSNMEEAVLTSYSAIVRKCQWHKFVESLKRLSVLEMTGKHRLIENIGRVK
jgi:hypothetical protein